MGWKFLNNAYGITTKYSVIHMHTLNIVKEKTKKNAPSFWDLVVNMF